MSKKRQKKSSKSPNRKATRLSGKTPAGQAASRSRKTTVAKSSKNVKGGPTRALHKPAATRSKRPATAKHSTSIRSVLAEGAKAPSFELARDGGSSVSLADYAGKKLVLFFYPRADTPGCTREAIDFTRLSSAFAEAGAAVLGVSGDPLKSQEAFRDKHKLSVPLLSDENHNILAAYGAWGEKSMYGRSFQGILRTTILIGADGRIIKIWRNVRVDGHAEEVLAAARAA